MWLFLLNTMRILINYFSIQIPHPLFSLHANEINAWNSLKFMTRDLYKLPITVSRWGLKKKMFNYFLIFQIVCYTVRLLLGTTSTEVIDWKECDEMVEGEKKREKRVRRTSSDGKLWAEVEPWPVAKKHFQEERRWKRLSVKKTLITRGGKWTRRGVNVCLLLNIGVSTPIFSRNRRALGF